MKVYIMRGIPGSGKTTWVKQYLSNATICSADDFWVNKVTGVYEFDPLRIGEAHDQCLRYFLEFTRQWPDVKGTLVVDNTNIRLYEIAPYYRIVEARKAEVEIVWVHCDPILAASRTLHGVPPEKVREMAQSFEPLPPWWKVRHVYSEVK